MPVWSTWTRALAVHLLAQAGEAMEEIWLQTPSWWPAPQPILSQRARVSPNFAYVCRYKKTLKMTVDSWSLINYYAPSIFRPLILPGEVRKRPMWLTTTTCVTRRPPWRHHRHRGQRGATERGDRPPWVWPRKSTADRWAFNQHLILI